MEEKDVSNIANAVSREIAKLNADIKEKEKPHPEYVNEIVLPEVFKCPDCGGDVVGGIPYCSHCGCPLEWGE